MLCRTQIFWVSSKYERRFSSIFEHKLHQALDIPTYSNIFIKWTLNVRRVFPSIWLWFEQKMTFSNFERVWMHSFPRGNERTSSGSKFNTTLKIMKISISAISAFTENVDHIIYCFSPLGDTRPTDNADNFRWLISLSTNSTLCRLGLSSKTPLSIFRIAFLLSDKCSRLVGKLNLLSDLMRFPLASNRFRLNPLFNL